MNTSLKETALKMIHTIREAFNELLAENHWMDDETRGVAKEKADAMNERIGYPELITNSEELINEYVTVCLSIIYIYIYKRQNKTFLLPFDIRVFHLLENKIKHKKGGSYTYFFQRNYKILNLF